MNACLITAHFHDLGAAPMGAALTSARPVHEQRPALGVAGAILTTPPLPEHSDAHALICMCGSPRAIKQISVQAADQHPITHATTPVLTTAPPTSPSTPSAFLQKLMPALWQNSNPFVVGVSPCLPLMRRTQVVDTKAHDLHGCLVIKSFSGIKSLLYSTTGSHSLTPATPFLLRPQPNMKPTPSSLPRFSLEYFKVVTFGELFQLHLPRTYPVSTICATSWSRSHPLDVLDKVLATDIIPHLTDLQPLLGEVEQRERTGYISVAVELHSGPASFQQVWSIAKIRSFVAIHNNAEAIHLATALYSFLRMRADSSSAAATYLNTLSALPICTPVTGFTTSATIWSLGCLVGETQIFDTVLDLHVERAYLNHHIAFPTAPAPLIFPSLFAHILVASHQADSTRYSGQLSRIRRDILHLIQSNNYTGIAFVHCAAAHFISYFLTCTSTLFIGDSLASTSSAASSIGDANLIPSLRWLLRGLPLPPIVDIRPMDVAIQPPGSQSCGLVAFNGIERLMCLPGIAKWDPAASEDFRASCLMRILGHYHRSLHFEEPLSWYSPIQELYELADDAAHEGPFWDCWTAKVIEINHPFLDLSTPLPPPPTASASSSNNHPVLTRSRVTTPAFYIPPTPFLLGSPIDLTTPSPSSAHVRSRSPTADIIDGFKKLLSPERKRRRHHSPKRFASVIVISDSELELESGSGMDSTSGGCSGNPIVLLDSESASDSLPDLDEVLGFQNPTKSESRAAQVGQPALRSGLCQPTPSTPVSTSLRINSIFESQQAGVDAIKADAVAHGYVMRRDQSKTDSSGVVRRLTMRCKNAYAPQEQHDPTIDPRDHRRSKSFRTNCSAHVNISRTGGSLEAYRITLLDLNHNHPPILPSGGQAQQPPTERQREYIDKYGPVEGFTSRTLRHILQKEGVDHPLEPRQLTNLINESRRNAREEVASLGGDTATVLSRLEALRHIDPRWEYRVRTGDDDRITALWWQSPEQASLVAEYPDVLIADNAQNRNQYGYPLNVGIVIDGHCSSRNAWYCFQEREDAATHAWVLENHLSTAPKPLETFISDRDPALESIVPRILPSTFHAICLHHLEGNVKQNLSAALGPADWEHFQRDFWAMYRSVSPEIFQTRFDELVARFPVTEHYLRTNLWPVRHRWAHAWVSLKFTAGVRTNGRVEVENRTNKILGGPKVSFAQLFERLNRRTDDQTNKHRIAVRQSSRRRHPALWERIFAPVLNQLEAHAGAYAFQVCYRELERSLAYTVSDVPIPEDVRGWAESLRLAQQEPGFNWVSEEETAMVNRYLHDASYVATAWLLHQVLACRLRIRRIVSVTLPGVGTTARHVVILLDNDTHLCDCCMGVNLGIPCRHFFAVLRAFSSHVRFHIGLIRPRWYQNPRLDANTIPSITLDSVAADRPLLSGAILANPLHEPFQPVRPTGKNTPPPPTQTISAQEVFHHSQAALKAVTRGIKTQEDLEGLLNGMAKIDSRQKALLETRQPRTIRDPIVLNPKGRPREKRLAASREGLGKSSGGGANGQIRLTLATHRPSAVATSGLVAEEAALGDSDSADQVAQPDLPSSRRRCGFCKRPGHNQRTCPQKQLESQDPDSRQ